MNASITLGITDRWKWYPGALLAGGKGPNMIFFMCFYVCVSWWEPK